MPDPVPQPASKGKPKAAIDNKNKTDLPLDFSFKDLTDIEELNNEEARELTKGKPERIGEAEKYRGTVLKLNNNMLKDISKLPAALEPVLFNPMELTWIDLSCNELTVISEILCDFRSLKILYLQGNLIKDLKEVDKLVGLPSLRKLALHGNQLDREKGYRLYCIKKIPHLDTFDFNLITKAERKTAECFKPEIKRKKKKEAES